MGKNRRTRVSITFNLAGINTTQEDKNYLVFNIQRLGICLSDEDYSMRRRKCPMNVVEEPDEESADGAIEEEPIEEIVDESAAEGLVTVVNNVKELRALAKQRGVKYFSRMGSTQLCEILNAKVVKKYKGRTIDTKFEKIVEESV